MRFARRFIAAIQFGAALWTLLTPQFALAYDRHLSDDAVREAYFLGQDVRSVTQFLSPYLKSLPVPSSGPDVAEIELSTPYAQVVEDSAQHTVGYSAQQAANAYRSRGDSIQVRVKILFTPTYTNADDGYWSTVPVGLIQKEKHMSATAVSGQAVYAADADADSPFAIGADVYVTFSTAGVTSDSLQVEVIPPGGRPVHANFDLSSLR